MAKCNVQNRTVFCRDNLEVLEGLNSNCIDLIYLDPPFNKKKVFTARMGSHAEGAGFSDIFRQEDLKEEWLQRIKEDQEKLHIFLESVKAIEGRTSYNFCYLSYMAIRLMECHRILKETGSLYLHCDPTMSHYLKILLDIIFTSQNFRNEIIWGYRTGGNSRRYFSKKHDLIYFFSKSEKYFFETQFYLSLQKYRYGFGRKHGYDLIQKDGGFYKKAICRDLWDDIDSIGTLGRRGEPRLGYPTQKPLKLLRRIIRASCPEGGVVLDPFCGCATTCVAAEGLERQWIGIDTSIKAYELVKKRLTEEVANPEDLLKYEKEINFSTGIPERTDEGGGDGRIRKWIYIISNQRFLGEYKVGVAKDWKSRLNSYQTSDPDRGFKVEYCELTDRFREVEEHIHKRFKNKHEWVIGELKSMIEEIKKFLSS